jgi:hypothetical protein
MKVNPSDLDKLSVNVMEMRDDLIVKQAYKIRHLMHAIIIPLG